MEPGAGSWEPHIKIEYLESAERDPLARRARAARPAPAPAPAPPPALHSPRTPPLETSHQKENWYGNINDLGKLVCRFCDLTYSTVQTLRFHVKTKHPIEAISLKKTISKGIRSPKLFCHLCMEKFKILDHLKRHVREHDALDDHKFICDYCNGVFDSKKGVKRHISEKHVDCYGNFYKKITKKVIFQEEIRKFPCPHCAHVAKRKYGLTIHIKARHKTEKDLSFICPFCPYKSSIKYYLQNHIVSNHPHSDFAATKVTYSCDICGYRTAKKSHYFIHKKTHIHAEKAHKCDFCDYRTNVHGNLEVHTRTHTKDKPYVCDFEECDYRSGTSSALKSHKLKHFPCENMLYCDKCNYKSVYKSSLKKHLESHYRNRLKMQ